MFHTSVLPILNLQLAYVFRRQSDGPALQRFLRILFLWGPPLEIKHPWYVLLQSLISMLRLLICIQQLTYDPPCPDLTKSDQVCHSWYSPICPNHFYLLFCMNVGFRFVLSLQQVVFLVQIEIFHCMAFLQLTLTYLA